MKTFIVLILLTVTMVGISGIVHAEYKTETRQEVTEMLQKFYEVEQGNRLSIFSMRALISEIDAIFGKNVMETLAEKEKENPGKK